MFCCVSEPRTLSNLQCLWEPVQWGSSQLGVRTEKEVSVGGRRLLDQLLTLEAWPSCWWGKVSQSQTGQKICALHSSFHLTWIHVWTWVFLLHISAMIWHIKSFQIECWSSVYLKLKMLVLDFFPLCVCGSFSTLFFLKVVCLKETLRFSGKITAGKVQKLLQLCSVAWLCWTVTVYDCY